MEKRKEDWKKARKNERKGRRDETERKEGEEKIKRKEERKEGGSEGKIEITKNQRVSTFSHLPCMQLGQDLFLELYMVT